MITFEELKTYTQEELIEVSKMIGDLLSNKTDSLDTFFNLLDTKSLKNITVQSIYELYIKWCGENEILCIDKKIFYKVCHNYIKKYNIKLTVREKTKIEKPKETGVKTSSVEK